MKSFAVARDFECIVCVCLDLTCMPDLGVPALAKELDKVVLVAKGVRSSYTSVQLAVCRYHGCVVCVRLLEGEEKLLRERGLDCAMGNTDHAFYCMECETRTDGSKGNCWP
jgi:hypothetical protein